VDLPQEKTHETALHMAATSNNLPVVQTLVHDCMANPDITTEELGYAALHHAIVKDNLEVIQWLVDHSTCNLNLQVAYQEKWDPTATQKVKEEEAEAAAKDKRKANKYGTVLGESYGLESTTAASALRPPRKLLVTPLILSVLEGSLEGILLLLGAKKDRKCKRTSFADPNIAEGNSGKTALHYATKFGRMDVIRVLVGTGRADASQVCTERKVPPLVVACENGHISLVKYYLDEIQVSDDFTELTEGGFSPLYLARSAGHGLVARYLETRAPRGIVATIFQQEGEKMAETRKLSLSSRLFHKASEKLFKQKFANELMGAHIEFVEATEASESIDDAEFEAMAAKLGLRRDSTNGRDSARLHKDSTGGNGRESDSNLSSPKAGRELSVLKALDTVLKQERDQEEFDSFDGNRGRVSHRKATIRRRSSMTSSEVEGLTLGGFDFAALQAEGSTQSPTVMNEEEEDAFNASSDSDEIDDGGIEGADGDSHGRGRGRRRSSQIMVDAGKMAGMYDEPNASPPTVEEGRGR
jgi:ankyrin repeat protein